MIKPSAIDGQVNSDNKNANPNLNRASQAAGINYGDKVMLDKISCVSSLAGEYRVLLLKGSEWTDPTLKLNERSPDCCRKMDKTNPFPVHDKDSAEDHEKDKRQVDNNQEVSNDPVAHREKSSCPGTLIFQLRGRASVKYEGYALTGRGYPIP